MGFEFSFWVSGSEVSVEGLGYCPQPVTVHKWHLGLYLVTYFGYCLHSVIVGPYYLTYSEVTYGPESYPCYRLLLVGGSTRHIALSKGY